LQSTFEAAATLAGWERAALEVPAWAEPGTQYPNPRG
jgi:hypothetical protein